MSEQQENCKDCNRECTERCQYHPDYWKASAHKTAAFVLERFEPRKCDCEAVSHCERCSVVALARWMQQKVLNHNATRPAPSPEVERVVKAAQAFVDACRTYVIQRMDPDLWGLLQTLKDALDATREDGLDRMIDGGRQEWTMDGQEQDKPAERGEG